MSSTAARRSRTVTCLPLEAGQPAQGALPSRAARTVIERPDWFGRAHSTSRCAAGIRSPLPEYGIARAAHGVRFACHGHRRGTTTLSRLHMESLCKAEPTRAIRCPKATGFSAANGRATSSVFSAGMRFGFVSRSARSRRPCRSALCLTAHRWWCTPKSAPTCCWSRCRARASAWPGSATRARRWTPPTTRWSTCAAWRRCSMAARSTCWCCAWPWRV